MLLAFSSPNGIPGHGRGSLLRRYGFCIYIRAASNLIRGKAHSAQEADCIRIVPKLHRGQGDIVQLNKKDVADVKTYTFNYQRDTYIVESTSPVTFSRLPYPSSNSPLLSTFREPIGLRSNDLPSLHDLYGGNEFNIPIPSFSELFSEHATAPFFVFQVFCVALWCMDEYWYYSLFTLFMLIVFECTVVWQVSFFRLIFSDAKLTDYVYSE